MAKASLIEAKKAQAAQDQAEALAALQEQLARVEAKVDQLIDHATAAPKVSTKKGAV
jgi:hypothetical protein